MDKKIKIIGVMSLFIALLQGSNSSSYDDLMKSLQSELDGKNSFAMSSIEGDADRLISSMGEIPADLVDSHNWYNPVKWVSAPVSYVSYYTNSSNLRYHNKKIYTPADFKDRKTVWLKALYENYQKIFNGIDELINYLTTDIDALKNKKNKAQDKNLKDYLDRMVFAAQEGLQKFIEIKNLGQEKVVNKKLEELLVSYVPSISLPKLLVDCLADAEQGLNIAMQSKDEFSVAAHRKVLAFLDDVAREIMLLKRANSLEDALVVAQNKLSGFKRTKNSSNANGTAFDGQIKLYETVIGALQAEAAQEVLEITKFEEELKKANVAVNKVIQDWGSARKAHIQAKEELMMLESALQRLESLRNPANKKLIEAKKLEIKDQYFILQQLDLKLKEEQELERLQDRKVDELVRNLLIKYNSNVSKALAEALTKISSNNSYLTKIMSGDLNSSVAKIKNIKDKKEKDEKLSDDEKVVLRLNQKLEEEKLNDPFDRALKQLNMSKTVDVPQALEGVIGAALGRIGLSIDRLDMTTRQKLADDLKLTSADLIKIMENPRLSEQQKQMQKQDVVKAMLTRNSSLLASGVTGASLAALQAGNAQTIATDIALNKLVNTLVPTTVVPAFDLSAMNY